MTCETEFASINIVILKLSDDIIERQASFPAFEQLERYAMFKNLAWDSRIILYTADFLVFIISVSVFLL